MIFHPWIVLAALGSVVLFLSLCVFLFFHFKALFLKTAPFVSTRKKLLSQIIDALALTDNSVLYDLGCGDGIILSAALEKTPRAKGVGVDTNIFACVMAKLRTRGLPIEILHKDFYSLNLQNATHIYIYLFPQTLQMLEKKILTECRVGTTIVSCDFSFPNLKPIKTINIDEPVMGMHTLYVYEA